MKPSGFSDAITHIGVEFSSRAVFSNAMPALSRIAAQQSKPIWFAAIALIAAAVIRYCEKPTFWLDEAFVALSLRNPSLQSIFGTLEAGQLFPRIYLAIIALLREGLGYRIWVLRLLPTLAFVVATLLWSSFLARRVRSACAAAFIAGALLLGSIFWLDQAIQLKQYTLDVLLALVPFVLNDEYYESSIVSGTRRWRLCLLVLPALVSYTYPIALLARLLGILALRFRLRSFSINKTAALILACSLAAVFLILWFTDYRFNFLIQGSYTSYWHDCILGYATGLRDGSRLVAKFLWGWHGRQPLVTAGIVPLQILGVVSLARSFKNRDIDKDWGTRSFGSLAVLFGAILASLTIAYPICAGRLTLFAQVHTQILAVEGAVFALRKWNSKNVTNVILYAFAAVVIFHSGRDFGRFVRSAPAEDLSPVLPEINTELASRVWVHSCSTAQVRSLPELPQLEFVFANDGIQPTGRTWVLWTHLGNAQCVSSLADVRAKAKSWTVVSEGPGRGLALADF